MSLKIYLILIIGILAVPAALLINDLNNTSNTDNTTHETESKIESTPTTPPTSSPTDTATPQPTTKSTYNPPPTSPPATTTKTPAPPKPANLIISVSNPEYGLCCGMIPTKVKITATPTIQNQGGLTAHDVSITFEMFTLSGKRILLSGRNQITRILGDMAGGEKITETIEFTFGIKDGYDLQKEGVRAVYNIHSQESDKRLVDEFTVEIE